MFIINNFYLLYSICVGSSISVLDGEILLISKLYKI